MTNKILIVNNILLNEYNGPSFAIPVQVICSVIISFESATNKLENMVD